MWQFLPYHMLPFTRGVEANMYREIFQTHLNEFHSTVWENRQKCQQNTFYYAVWQLFLYFHREFPLKILSVYAQTNTFFWKNHYYIYIYLKEHSFKSI